MTIFHQTMRAMSLSRESFEEERGFYDAKATEEAVDKWLKLLGEVK